MVGMVPATKKRKHAMKMIKVAIKTTDRGLYGFDFDLALVQTDIGWYLIQDEYCGEANIEGGAPRAHVYKLTDAQADIVLGMYDSTTSDWRDNDRNISVIEALVYDGEMRESQMLGRAIQYKWGSALCEMAGMVAS
jgi:hypothetical protein